MKGILTNVLRLPAFAALLFLAIGAGSVSAQDLAGDRVRAREQLDKAFGLLQSVEDGAAAVRAEALIWSLWMTAGRTEENATLAQAADDMGRGRFSVAERALSDLVVADPGYAEAWNKRATLYFLMGEYDKSLSDISRTLALEPRHFGALSGRGMILALQRKPKEALAAYEDAIAINPHMKGVRVAIRSLRALEPDL